MAATVSHAELLNQEREQVVSQYIANLQNADYKAMMQLFTKDSFVISTSHGKVDAKEFYYSFLPNITSATTELHQLSSSESDANRLTARFHFTFKMKDGSQENGEYIDEFTFANDSQKLAAVYMFENLHFTE